MTNGATILSTHNLSVGYKDARNPLFLLKDLNLRLEAGKLVCFMGPNGIGKSTLIKTLAGAHAPLAGTIENHSNQKNALVLTERVQSQAMKVHELVSYGRYPYLPWTLRMNNEDLAKVEAAMQRLRIMHLADQRIAELSDGQMQMVMISRALAQDADALLMDEPTAHLDLNNRVEVMNMLREIARENNKAILVATHELDLALQTSDLIWLATHEKTIEAGLPEDLVLDGSFDEVFQFKGFDLKTGKVKQQPYRKASVRLQGEGHVYLWTKNALERTGYTVSSDSSCVVTIDESAKEMWVITIGEQRHQASSVKHLLELIDTLISKLAAV